MRQAKFTNLEANELYWLAGYLEGEGSFTITNPKFFSTRITVGSTDMEPIQHVAQLIGGNVSSAVYKMRVSKEPKTVYRTSASGLDAIHIMMQLLPMMSQRRRIQIMSCVAHASKKYKSRRDGDENGVIE